MPLIGHLDYTAKRVKITKKPRKPSNSSVLLDHIEFCETV